MVDDFGPAERMHVVVRPPLGVANDDAVVCVEEVEVLQPGILVRTRGCGYQQHS